MAGEKTKAKSKSQREHFEDAARALECDESEERFDAALRKIAAHKTRKDGGSGTSDRNPMPSKGTALSSKK